MFKNKLQLRMMTVILMIGILYLFTFYLLLKIFDNLLIPLLFVSIFPFIQYYFSDKLALFMMRCKKIKYDDNPFLFDMVIELSKQSNVPMPKVAISNMPVANAFATGRNKKHAVVCVTETLLSILNTEELEAVLAHEISHIKHRDVFVMSLASFISAIIGFISRTLLLRMLFSSSEDSRNRNGLEDILGFIISIVVELLAFILISALSRFRELNADRASAYLTRKPSNLISALRKLDAFYRNPMNNMFTQSTSSMNSMMFFRIGNLFSTHPTLEKRINQLNKIENDLKYKDDNRETYIEIK